MDTAWLGSLLQVTDSIHPTGSYAHSFGLEGLVELGAVSDPASLRAFLLEVAVPSLTRTDLPLVAWAHRRLAAGDWAGVVRVAQLCGALKGTRELRFASARIGSQRLDLMRQLLPDPRLERLHEALREAGVEPYAPVAAAAHAVVAGVPLEAALVAAYYQGVSGFITAAMKLLRIGQNAAHGLLTEAMARCADSVRDARSVALEDAGSFTPVLDIASARHESAYSRIFIS